MRDFQNFPEKPVLSKPTEDSNWGLTFFSIVLFIGVFLLFFDHEFEFVTHLVLVLIIHEFGHFLAMKWFRYKNVKMLFIPLMGAFVQGFKDKYSQRESLLVVLAGPVPGIILGVVCFFIAVAFEIPSLLNLSVLFLFLNIINLLPIDPLDGGQIVKLLAKKRRDLFLLVFAFISSIVLIIAGFLMDVWVLMIFGFLMGVRVRNLQKNLQQRKDLDNRNIKYECTYHELTNAQYAELRQYVIENNTLLRKYLTYAEEVDEAVLASHVQALLVAPVRYDVGTLGKLAVFLVWFFTTIVLPILLVVLLALEIVSIDWYFKAPIV
jgi:Zn-dependent protease